MVTYQNKVFSFFSARNYFWIHLKKILDPIDLNWKFYSTEVNIKV